MLKVREVLMIQYINYKYGGPELKIPINKKSQLKMFLNVNPKRIAIK